MQLEDVISTEFVNRWALGAHCGLQRQLQQARRHQLPKTPQPHPQQFSFIQRRLSCASWWARANSVALAARAGELVSRIKD